MSVTLRLSFDDVASRGQLAALRAAGSDLSGLLSRIGAALHGSTIERFGTSRGPDGTAWKPSRRALEEGGKTLVDSGDLRDRMTWRSDGTSAEVGSNLIYAGVHQVGATILPRKPGGALRFKLRGANRDTVVKSVKLPARPFLGISAEDRLTIDEIVVGELAAATGGAVR